MRLRVRHCVGTGHRARGIPAGLTVHTRASRTRHRHPASLRWQPTQYALRCGAAGQAADLIATARNINGAYVEWRRIERSGRRRAQASVIPLWERTRHFRAYSSWLVPGPFQTRAYIEALLRSIRDRRALPDDLKEAAEPADQTSRSVLTAPLNSGASAKEVTRLRI
ncbi:Scr1 family TA system antitoxin-like transcriptional regulator [Streptomyces sp. ME18-1-4]|uniref:Scr1 family TA system antitoxin-like transcriptional regulator n=1 Tax=Streptomyces sp. ME18-1-4 TaxID=3028685 RepID=UPI0029C9C418|nr:Scr1 family TA system antitoxin-like transcriptional regulator [Streptomyces sp. ME18-1-4]